MSKEFTKCRRDLFGGIGFADKPAVCGQFVGNIQPRSHNQVDGWPATPDRVGEPKPIHRTRHVNVREDGANIATALQKPDGLICVGRLHGGISGVFDHMDSAHPNQHFRIHDQDGWLFHCLARV